jgi:hypothetical protein
MQRVQKFGTNINIKRQAQARLFKKTENTLFYFFFLTNLLCMILDILFSFQMCLAI